ncbi:urease accessory protein UreD [Loktanella sp. 5RATIMAR09]|uniref:urease accessory protein UreD n=1 Tax=Loktanella sp. 5RATIMAR09 TaxID=1225655 RepID=UPI00336BDABB
MAGGLKGRTGLVHLRHAGSSKLVFPRNFNNALEAILVNTAGGITGGDQYTLDAAVRTGGTLTMTTQAAERAYRAQVGEVGCVDSKLTVGADATLNWLPQELILFDHCALRRSLHIDLQGNANLLMVEPIVLGRAAMKETLRQIYFQDRIRVNRDGAPIYIDGMDFSGDAAAHVARRAIADGARAMASLVLVRPDAAAQLDTLRAMLPPTAGASLLADDVLVIRQLAEDSFALRRDLMPILGHLTNNSLPISWRL